SRVRFAGGNYTVNGTSTITLGSGLTEPRIIVEAGSHTITAPLSIQKNVGYAAYSGATLTLAGPTYANAAINITKWGAGTVVHPAIRQDNVHIRDGTLKITPSSGTSKIKSLT